MPRLAAALTMLAGRILPFPPDWASRWCGTKARGLERGLLVVAIQSKLRFSRRQKEILPYCPLGFRHSGPNPTTHRITLGGHHHSHGSECQTPHSCTFSNFALLEPVVRTWRQVEHIPHQSDKPNHCGYHDHQQHGASPVRTGKPPLNRGPWAWFHTVFT